MRFPMKKKLFLLAIPAILLTSCKIIYVNSSSSSSSSLSTAITSSSSTSSTISNSSTNTNISSSNTSSSTSSSFSSTSSSNNISTSTSSSTSSSSFSSSFDDSSLNKLVINTTISYGGYSDNYDRTAINGFLFYYYRAAYYTDGILTIKPALNIYNTPSLPGLFYNGNKISGIRKIDITYRTLDGTKNPTLRYGIDNTTSKSTSMPISATNYSTFSFVIPESNFFKIETGDVDLTIKEMTIYYTGNEISYNTNYLDYGTSNQFTRLNPVTFDGKLVPGESYVTVPIDIETDGDSYVVKSYKKYTYYDLNYVIDHPEVKDDAMQIDPMDVANYFIAFNEAPANYAKSNNSSEPAKVFGSNFRCISTYKRTNGYATSVPWANYLSNNYPLYHEFDIDIDGHYSKNSRGSGRVVIFEAGFSKSKGATNYSNAPVALYTDDHYATFAEYLNNGTFSPHFNSEIDATDYQWSCVKTLNV